MSASRSKGGSPSRPKWRQVLELGEQLSCLARQALEDASPVQAKIAAQRELIVATAARLLGGQATLWLAESVARGFTGKLQAGASVTGEAAAEPPSLLMRSALQARQPCSGESVDEACPSELVGRDRGGQRTSTGASIRAIAAPLLIPVDDDGVAEVLGVLQVECPQGTAFERQEVDLLEGLAVQAALALQSSLQMINERWRLEQLSLVRQVNAQIANVRDLDELSRRVTALIQQAFNYYYVAIFTLESHQDILHFRASAGPGYTQAAERQPVEGEQSYSPTLIVHMGQGIIGHVAETGSEILANDVQDERLYRHLDVLPETRAEVTLPLKVEDRLLGVLDVQSNQPGYFDETDMLVLRALATNIAFAVNGAQLYSALQRRASQLSAVYEVSNAITSIFDQEELLDEVVDLIHKRFGYPFVHLFSVHPGRRKIFYEAGSGEASQRMREQGFAYDLDDPQGLVPWVARHKETVTVNDVAQEPRCCDAEFSLEEARSELTVPLIFGDQVLGVLDVQGDHLSAFGEEDRFLFEALADNIAIAMRNAQLYRSEVWRRQVADGLREVAGLLSADVDLERVLEAILAELERTLPLDMAAIWLLDRESQAGESQAEPPLYLAAVRGGCVSALDLEVGLSPEDILEFNPPAELKYIPEPASAWLVEALDEGQPVIRSPQSLFDPLGAALDFPSEYSAIAAPLRVGEDRLGVLTLAHRTPGRYGSEAHAMTAAFASYAAVAIENARLYEAAHDQAWVSTVLLQVAQATQSIVELNELLTTVIRITPMLVGVKACLLYILDEEGDFVPAAASGLDDEQQVEFERWRFAPGDVPALDHMAQSQLPVILHGDADDLSLSSILFPVDQIASALRNELLVLVPLLARGEVLGAFLVDYKAGPRGNSAALDTFFDERLSIIQGIAHQTAVAVENIRLIKSQKEEAYVSVALLQVAQAVVSSSDLEEALGAIVRITPILVGVERAMVFLWDKEQSVFRLSQSYGIPREATLRQYGRGEFPLLDAVWEENSLFAYPLSGAEELFTDVPDEWSFLLPPDPDEVDLLLENEACLLMAIPLAVKGDVLGVLLVEEPELATVEGAGGASANRRLRAKRLEIVTGISQQAALAIQNDLLQLEMVERERLEREMQLARDIQRTFLPQTLPDLDGWDLQVRWRTAREVGGDFYDYFDLPGERLGVVIADVADKGMPAALFMTLVRTVLRATVSQIASPAEALDRVNDLIVPDATQGMFVTLAYAVVSLQTGEVEIANAGHNPPLVVRHDTCELMHLTRGGMALGVLEGNRITGRKLVLEAGDILIMYTDGVTEAFSPDGDLFGDQRLYATIDQAARSAVQAHPQGASAQAMLDAVDRAVVDFIGDGMPSDDLTLLVLKRLG